MQKQKKILTIVGARPQLIKCAALSPALLNKFNQVIVHTGQHYQDELSGNLIQELDMPLPDYQLGVSGGSGLSQIGRMLLELEPVIELERPDLILVFGDTNSTAAGALSATKCRVPLAHVEAGMREFDKRIPEESNKLITSVLADFHFCASQSGIKWLKEMGIQQHVYLSGDVMLDLIDDRIELIEKNDRILERFHLSPRKYVFTTVHRSANTDFAENLWQIINALNEIEKPIIWPLHPRTLAAIGEEGRKKIRDHIRLTEPLGWLDTQSLIRNAAFVITDSGGVTKEAFHHKTPGILVDKQTEWIETVEQGWNHQTGPDKNKILLTSENLKIPTFQQGYNSGGRAGELIAETLFQLLNK